MKPTVFISYSHKNRRTAIRLAEDLDRNKITYWVDRERLETGDPLLDTIQEVLKRIRILALLCEENDRKWGQPSTIDYGP